MNPRSAPAHAAADRRLLNRVIGGDAEALRSIYDRCSARAFGIAQQILRARPDAEEILQETFLEVWKRAREFDPARGSVEGWVVTIARSRSIDRLRARGAAARTRESDPSSSMSQAAPPPLEAAERREARERVGAALNALPVEQREVLELAYFEGLSQSEIAARLAQPLGTVKTRVRLGMEKLAGLLAEPEALP